VRMIYGTKHGNGEKEAILWYPRFGLAPEFADHLARELSSEIYVFSVTDDRGAHLTQPPPWVEIAFIFSSSAVATAFLAKLGEDIYAKLKAAVTAAFKKRAAPLEAAGGDAEQETDARLHVTIAIHVEGQPGIAVRGHANGDAETVTEAIGASRLMLQDALRLSGFPADTEYRAALWFLYDYDASNSRWTLRGVRQGSLEKELEWYRSL